MEPPSVDRLIREVAETGRQATDAELQQIREHVTQAAFDPNARERVRGQLAGLVWQGKTLRGSDLLPPSDVHYLRHVIHREEWPAGTSMDNYLESIVRAVLSSEGGVLLGRFQGVLQVGFFGPAGLLRGPDGAEWILVEYRVDTGHCVTAYQVDLDTALRNSARSDLRWMTPVPLPGA